LELTGTWHLEVSTPFGKHPATLVLEREADGRFGGHIDSRLGSATLGGVSANATGGFDAVVTLELQGRSYEARVNATVEDGRMDGTIKVNIPLAPPARFTGTRGQTSG
jgi:hypothetical protein